jgi:hypothetical protein
MSTVVVATVKSNSSSPPTFENTSGTEIGRLCRAFVNFNGTGTVAINGQYNVSSITDNGTGDYTVNFTAALADANYSVAHGKINEQGSVSSMSVIISNTSSSHRLQTYIANPSIYYSTRDESIVCVSIFR